MLTNEQKDEIAAAIRVCTNFCNQYESYRLEFNASYSGELPRNPATDNALIMPLVNILAKQQTGFIDLERIVAISDSANSQVFMNLQVVLVRARSWEMSNEIFELIREFVGFDALKKIAKKVLPILAAKSLLSSHALTKQKIIEFMVDRAVSKATREELLIFLILCRNEGDESQDKSQINAFCQSWATSWGKIDLSILDKSVLTCDKPFRLLIHVSRNNKAPETLIIKAQYGPDNVSYQPANCEIKSADLPSTIDMLVRDFHKYIKDVVPDTQFQVELLLPVELLEQRWEIMVGDEPQNLALVRPTVLRSWDRYFNSKFGDLPREYFLDKLPHLTEQGKILKHSLWIKTHKDLMSNTLQNRLRTALALISLTMSFPENNEITSMVIFKKMLNNGVPVMMWLHGTEHDEELAEHQLKEFGKCNIHLMAKNLHEMQTNQEEEDHILNIASALVLLNDYDDIPNDPIILAQ